METKLENRLNMKDLDRLQDAFMVGVYDSYTNVYKSLDKQHMLKYIFSLKMNCDDWSGSDYWYW